MKTNALLLVLFITVSACLRGQQANGGVSTVLFEKNSQLLTPLSKSRLDSLVKCIKPGEELGITGFTDSDADDMYNKALSQRRATEVKNYLRNKGITNRLHLDWKGEGAPLNNNSLETEKTLNRRVEILRDYANYNDVFNAFKKEYQVFTINPGRDIVLTCAGGQVLQFAANSLETARGEPVTIKVQEFCSKGDFVLAGLNTQGPGNALLESGGMMNIEAFQSGKNIELKAGRELKIRFAGRKPDDKMQLFNGTKTGKALAWLKLNQTIHHVHSTASPVEKKDVTENILSDTTSLRTIRSVDAFYIVGANGGLTKVESVAYESYCQAASMLSTTRLGWINCDRFYDNSKTKVNLTVAYEAQLMPFLSIIFKDINSLMSSSTQQNNNATFNDIPEGRVVTIVAIYKPLNNNKVFFAMKEVTTSRELNVSLNFDELDSDEVKKRLNSL